MAACPLCEDNDRQAAGTLAAGVAELGTGWVRLNSNQRYRGAAFFVAKRCVREVYDLDAEERSAHLEELAQVSAAIASVFAPVKMNIESLGNGVPHLHWWLTPRHADDPRPRGPIWENLDFLREFWTGDGQSPDDELAESASRLREELSARGLIA